MSDLEDSTADSPSPVKPTKSKPPRKQITSENEAASHPKTSAMVNSAIENLKERGGSSLHAIKKYIVTNYKVDPEKVAPLIKRYLKSAVLNGTLVQTKGTGARGSFKLPAKDKKANKNTFNEDKTSDTSPIKKEEKKKEAKPLTTKKQNKVKTAKEEEKETTEEPAKKPKAKEKLNVPKKKPEKKIPAKKPKSPKAGTQEKMKIPKKAKKVVPKKK
ncbi:hypothetical protein RUM43_015103 [Polyplax serrata]|uniref:H15 domain-containing protein n=1 Tax=Polyplax serrata TaxID=468196 RepID=A0AAN8Q1S0_POLSC